MATDFTIQHLVERYERRIAQIADDAPTLGAQGYYLAGREIATLRGVIADLGALPSSGGLADILMLRLDALKSALDGQPNTEEVQFAYDRVLRAALKIERGATRPAVPSDPRRQATPSPSR